MVYYIKGCIRSFNFGKATNAKETALIPIMHSLVPDTLDESMNNEVIEAYARFIYAKTIIDSSLLYKDAWDNVKKIKEVRNMFSTNAKVNKYYVKCLLQGESR
jgi:hypothetical protein